MARLGWRRCGWIGQDHRERRNFFPFQIGPPLVGLPAYNANFEEVFTQVWRVKLMRADVAVTIDHGAGVVFIWNYTAYYTTVSIPSGAGYPTNELALACANSGSLVAVSGIPDPTAFGVGLYRINDFDLVSGLFEIVVVAAGNGVTTDPNSGGSPTGISVDILGRSFPTYAAAGITASGSLTLSIDSYWEYRDGAGNNPLYDGVTGVRTTNPLSWDANR